MLDQTISDILKAEAEADEIIKAANEDAKIMVANATAEAETRKNDVIASVKAERKAVVNSASEDGDKQYAEIIALGEKQAAKLTANTDIGAAVAYIKEKVFNKYGNS